MIVHHGNCGELEVKAKVEFGVWNCLSSVELSFTLGEIFDFIYIDLEHGFRSVENLTLTVKFYNLQKINFAVRIRSYNDPIIQTLLDIGVRNFILPQLRLLSELDEFKKRVLFPPDGVRGLHPRSKFNSNTPLVDSISITILVETIESIELLEAFAEDELVNGFYFGAFDLSMELQIIDGPFSSNLNPYLSRVSDVCKKSGKKFQAMLPVVNDVDFIERYSIDRALVGIDTVLIQECYLSIMRNLRGK
jgi:2-keto-3-deoxy-L-rhamnonate aldolase RhmA